MRAVAKDAKRKRSRGFLEHRGPTGHSRPPMVARRPKPGRPTADDPREKNYSFRVKKAYEKAIEAVAKEERRTANEMMRIIVGEYLIAKNLLPPDYEF